MICAIIDPQDIKKISTFGMLDIAFIVDPVCIKLCQYTFIRILCPGVKVEAGMDGRGKQ